MFNLAILNLKKKNTAKIKLTLLSCSIFSELREDRTCHRQTHCCSSHLLKACKKVKTPQQLINSLFYLVFVLLLILMFDM